MAEEHKTGRFLGIPYDWRRPTWEHLNRGVWNPDERQVFVPKVCRWGYGVNFHELARLLGFIERP